MDIIDTIFIDTSVFISEGYFKSTGRVSKLFDLAKQGYIRILLPVITEKEWLKHFQTETKLVFPDLGRKLSLIGPNKRVDQFLEQYSELKLYIDFDDEVRKSFDKYVNGPGVIRIDYSYFEDRLSVVFQKYFKQEKPFGSNGKSKEFPDAFVLAVLEKYAHENDIESITVFSNDNDMRGYHSDVIKIENIGTYLDDLLQSKIPIAHKEDQANDVNKLMNFIADCLLLFKQRVLDRIESYLYDPDRYSRRFAHIDVEEVYECDIQLEMTTDDMEVISINDNEIEACFFPKITGSVSIGLFDEEDSLWDPENREWVYQSYNDQNIEISSFIVMTTKLDRRELDMGQGPGVELLDIDFSPLQNSLDDDIFYV